MPQLSQVSPHPYPTKPNEEGARRTVSSSTFSRCPEEEKETKEVPQAGSLQATTEGASGEAGRSCRGARRLEEELRAARICQLSAWDQLKLFQGTLSEDPGEEDRPRRKRMIRQAGIDLEEDEATRHTDSFEFRKTLASTDSEQSGGARRRPRRRKRWSMGEDMRRQGQRRVVLEGEACQEEDSSPWHEEVSSPWHEGRAPPSYRDPPEYQTLPRQVCHREENIRGSC